MITGTGKDDLQGQAQDLHCPVLLPRGRDCELVCRFLRLHGLETLPCSCFSEVLDCMRNDCGPVILGDEAMGQSDWKDLREWCVHQPKWSELPVVILLRDGPRTEMLNVARQMRGATLLTRPIEKTTLAGLISVSAESRSHQYQVRDLLKQLEETNRILETRTSQLQRLAIVLTKAEESERRRVARLLHDELQQLLVAARIPLRRALPAGADEGPAAERRKAVEKADSLIRRAIHESRGLSHELSPPLLHQAGLGPALKKLAKSFGERYEMKVEFLWDDKGEHIGDNMRSFIYESARELLFNVHKHSGGNTAVMELRGVNDEIVLSVFDSGRGFEWHPDDEEKYDLSDAGNGLFGIREQALVLGGKLDVSTAPGKGTRMKLVMPFEVLHQSVDEAPHVQKEPQPETSARPAHSGKIRVVVADDHRVMRDGLVSLLEEVEEIDVVGEAGDGEAALRQARRLRPNVLVLDVSMPKVSGIDVARQLHTEMPDMQIIGLSMFEEETVARQMLDAGASVYLVKSGPGDSLVSSVLACRGS